MSFLTLLFICAVFAARYPPSDDPIKITSKSFFITFFMFSKHSEIFSFSGGQYLYFIGIACSVFFRSLPFVLSGDERYP